MKRLSLLFIPAVLLLALGMVLGRMPEAVSAQGSAPVHLTFDKSSVAPGIWEGTVAGDVEAKAFEFPILCYGRKEGHS